VCVDCGDIDLTLAAMDNMRKNFDIVPREEAIIKAGYVPAIVDVDGGDRNRIFRSIWGVLPGYRVR
jgi:hypothetical protein